MEFKDLTIGKASDLLFKKEVSSLDLTKIFLDRIEQTNTKLNSYITIDKKGALSLAKESDISRASGKTMDILDGIPMSLKDIIVTKNLRTTAASKMLSNFIPPYDAQVTSILKKEGAVITGKVNCDAWAHGASTEHSDFGPAHNPWDLNRVPGGSSGGSAISVASGQSIYSIGTDTGGSIRQPASFCGIVGLKPTYGRVSRYGLIAMASSLDVPGPMTKTVEDAAIILEKLAGFDSKDSTTSKSIPQKYTDFIGKDIKGLKIGIPKEYFIEGLDKEIKTTIEKAIKTLEAQGADIVKVSLPHTEYTVPTYYIIQPAEVSSNLGRYDGIRYGYTGEASDLLEQYLKSRAEGFGDEAKRRIMLGTYTLSSGYYEAYYLKASKVRNLIKQDFDNVFKEVDVLITPTAPTTAFKIGEKESDPIQMYLADVFTAGPSLAGIPAISIPVGFSSDNLPIGMQIIGPQFKEELLFQVGSNYEISTQNEDWRKRKVAI
ncbi:Asp-tRNA(Asn)/Glu-tRNA(Gln) amidotransferase subunit GatA [bacterium]|nr:Asp-tRNA(Asn)/Glu-tRNA(Gln) amidotransferase subunit GatA [bacterium]